MKYQPNKKVIEVYSKRAGKDVKYFEFLKSCLSNDLELESGLVLQFEKPRIKTEFCYGYSLYGCNTESYDNATESVEHAKNDIVHFIDANIHESMIKYYYDKFKKAEQVFYSASKDGLLSLDQLSDQEDKRDYQYEYGESPRYKEFINGELSKSDIQKILNILAEELQKFVKRLNTYLKRYGLSKVHSLYDVETLSQLINESIVTDNESLQWIYSNLLEAINENNQEHLITNVYDSLCLNIDATIRLDQVLGANLDDGYQYMIHISNRDLYKIVVTPDYEQSTLEFDRYTLDFISDIETVLNQLNDLLLSKTSYEQLRFEVEQDTINEYSNMLLVEVNSDNNIVDVNLNC